ncbi:phosphonate ABC transporter, permease protein PhnE [Anaerobacillus isosaccharinicus]|uniref:Phosphonate ABC transporter, permease protein PhnE n=1 Tax=Anaerobacillus isosaccharinicus TaxID=1532552 RepID=A0A1S2ME10_9BACI|nr:phosphonate ABC transporter, permease protein PhnE [Anaerobacillus isosaccharinicus]MBA5587811.1 phosphonate ABC transporter, permease protein PhnE [Anaerobacillus isosaccharinicus]QOY34033.1 phosphonate ABC transporter, permease protein PhnE [Anaerobacillus isosaccharinicus]
MQPVTNPLKTNNGRIPIIPRQTKTRMTIIMLVIAFLYGLSAFVTEAYPNKIISGLPHAFDFVKDDLYPPNWSYYKTVSFRLLETWNIALLSTTFSTLICLPFAFLMASNINTNKYLYTAVRFGMNVLRTIPELLLAVILVAVVGLGPLSGVGALFFFSLGILAKLLSETIESIDKGPLEAIRATGGNVFQVIRYGAMPQILPHFTSYSLYVLEINVRASIVLGFVGAGGIGQILRQQLNLFNYANVSTIIIMTFLAVTVIDVISTRIRERLV